MNERQKNRIFTICAILFFAILAYYAYVRWQKARAEQNTGNVEIVGVDTNKKVVVDRDELDRLRADAARSQSYMPPAENTGSSTTNHPAEPASDTLPVNPPNGMRFAGNGRYQLYRQGALTWRLDSVTGNTCVLFATEHAWRDPRVFSQGCAY